MDAIYNSCIIKPHIRQYMHQSQHCKVFITLPFQRLSVLCQPVEDQTGQNTKTGAVETDEGLKMLEVSEPEMS
ncbi:unnamed protein product [Boreogadus saida]